MTEPQKRARIAWKIGKTEGYGGWQSSTAEIGKLIATTIRLMEKECGTASYWLQWDYRGEDGKWLSGEA